MTFYFLEPIVCLNSKFPPPVELCWQNKNISKLGILITVITYNQSWQCNYFINMIRKHLVHKFILLLKFDFLPTYLLHFRKGFRSFPLF
jgi:hypothetical protein